MEDKKKFVMLDRALFEQIVYNEFMINKYKFIVDKDDLFIRIIFINCGGDTYYYDDDEFGLKSRADIQEAIRYFIDIPDESKFYSSDHSNIYTVSEFLLFEIQYGGLSNEELEILVKHYTNLKGFILHRSDIHYTERQEVMSTLESTNEESVTITNMELLKQLIMQDLAANKYLFTYSADRKQFESITIIDKNGLISKYPCNSGAYLQLAIRFFVEDSHANATQNLICNISSTFFDKVNSGDIDINKLSFYYNILKNFISNCNSVLHYTFKQ